MHKFLKDTVLLKRSVDGLQKNVRSVKNVSLLLKSARSVTTKSFNSDNLFPERADFPGRHIGPRDQDVVTMLDLLGYKVGIIA